MAAYKLYYFNGRGRAESIRFAFKQAGVEFEDVRLSGEEWGKFKPNTPFGVMPVLEVDGKKMGGSNVILRYLAEKFGLAGSNDWENAEIKSIVDCMNDFGQELAKCHFEKDETKKAELGEKLKAETLPRYLGICEKLIANNSSGWLYGSKVTYADFVLFNLMEWVKAMGAEALDSFPGIKANLDTVGALPNLKKWIEERPKTQF